MMKKTIPKKEDHSKKTKISAHITMHIMYIEHTVTGQKRKMLRVRDNRKEKVRNSSYGTEMKIKSLLS
jgi:hypothetical protein